jgi:hypothetical protein
LSEIEWFGANKVEFLFAADSNFGIFERDLDITDFIVEQYQRIGYPMRFHTDFAKKNQDRVFRIVRKLTDNKISHLGATLSFQSLDATVLKNVGRINMDLNYFRSIMLQYRDAGIQTYTELILCLPGETLQSFCDGVGILLDNGQHTGIQYYVCSLLPNSRLATPQMRGQFHFKTVRQLLTLNIEDKSDESLADIPEYMDMIVSTSTLTCDERETAQLFMAIMQGLHEFGLLRLLAIYFHYAKHISYQTFYMETLRFAQQNPGTIIGKSVSVVRQYQTGMFSQSESLPSLDVPGVLTGNVFEYHYIFGFVSLHLKQFYAEMRQFSSRFEDDMLLFDELLRFQHASMCQPGIPRKTEHFAYDFPRFFAAAYADTPIALKKKSVSLVFSDANNPVNWAEFGMKVIFKGHFSDRAFYKISYEQQDH